MVRITNRKEKQSRLTSLFVSTLAVAFVAILIGPSLSWRPLRVTAGSAVEGANKLAHRLPATIQGKVPKVKRPPQEPHLPLTIPVNPLASQQTVSKPIAASVTCPTTTTTTVIVGPGNQTATGWQSLQAIFGEPPPDNGTQTYEVGPLTPPLGVGSLEFRIGATNDWDEDVGYTMLNNTPLGNLTELSYSTFVETASNVAQDFYAILVIDTTGDHTADDFLFFFPATSRVAAITPLLNMRLSGINGSSPGMRVTASGFRHLVFAALRIPAAPPMTQNAFRPPGLLSDRTHH